MEKTDVALNADEPVGAGLLRVADELIEYAENRIRYPTADHGEDVHLTRVAIKRLRALLILIRPAINKTLFDRENSRLKTAGSRLSLARDLDVARQTLATLPLSRGPERGTVAAALAGFHQNGGSRSEVIRAMNHIELALEQTRRDLHRMRISGDEWNAIEPGLREVYRQCRKRMRRALARGDDDDFHKLRIRVKNLYYELEILRRAWPARLEKMIEDLRKLQEEIGADHDLVILKRTLNRIPDSVRNADTVEKVVTSVDDMTRKFRRQTKPLAREIFDQKSRHFVHKLGQHWAKWRRLV